ncbi:NUDIX hydrolase [Marinilabilia salmonicolor]|jgi:8-oxo-dGTP diphosphatase|uniref:8-oxo-dGTP diphosphatase n=1 Tax=Marinilabilia salmonicolor TaxID=989 RepID=A0A2T0XN24_9BACT|nr:NUDIX hydrolase [Marinilabilia salmonicolor]PRZ00334.1 8-oxo-dGTP diphosphatase [Marinilabilia salmonicolor]RCW34508.1 8-oxo-dGTP diphosphatase [Marinilabilia salmonicolor]
MQQKYCYDYPRPAVTADVVALAGSSLKEAKLLLIKREKPPFQDMWALPGGFAEMDEDIETTAVRELEEETGLRGGKVHQIGAFGKVGRDPRHRTVTVAFLSALEGIADVKGADDASDARWFPLEELPPLAFDHEEIVNQGVELWEKMDGKDRG